MVIDSHHHLWRYTTDEFGWIADDCLRRDFDVGDLEREISPAGVDRTIVCESRQCIEETDALLKTAEGREAVAGAHQDMLRRQLRVAVPQIRVDCCNFHLDSRVKGFVRVRCRVVEGAVQGDGEEVPDVNFGEIARRNRRI